MNWRRKEEYKAPLLDQVGSGHFPRSFYTAFSIVFGNLDSEEDTLLLLENINKLMNQRKGGGKIKKNEIIELRNRTCLDIDIETFLFWEGINKLIDRKKQKRKIEKDEIIELRNRSCLTINITEYCFYNNHHVVPRSRDSRLPELKDDQVVKVPEIFHRAWHILFLNLYGKEIISFLERVLFFVQRRKEIITHYILQQMIETMVKGGKKHIRA